MKITEAKPTDAEDIAALVKELLEEIMAETGVKHFSFNGEETITRAREFLEGGQYKVFLAIDGEEKPIGFAAVYESYALYAEGAFGTMSELYVRPGFRSEGVGKDLVGAVIEWGNKQGWKRLEVTTPPLPQFKKTLSFYEREGFEVSGGKKLKLDL